MEYTIPSICYVCCSDANEDKSLETSHHMGAVVQYWRLSVRICSACKRRDSLASVGVGAFAGIAVAGLGYGFITMNARTGALTPGATLLYLTCLPLGLGLLFSKGFRNVIRILWLTMFDDKSTKLAPETWVSFSDASLAEGRPSFPNDAYRRVFWELNGYTAPAEADVASQQPEPINLTCIQCGASYPSKYYSKDEGRAGAVCTKCATQAKSG